MWIRVYCGLTSVSVNCVPVRTELQHRGRTAHSICLSVFQVVFNITYANGQVYLNDFPMRSGVAHITCQTVICEYSFFFSLQYFLSMSSSNESLQFLRVLILCKFQHSRSKFPKLGKFSYWYVWKKILVPCIQVTLIGLHLNGWIWTQDSACLFRRMFCRTS